MALAIGQLKRRELMKTWVEVKGTKAVLGLRAWTAKPPFLNERTPTDCFK